MKKIKKIVASLMAVAALSTSMVGITASAAQDTGNISTFVWSAGYAKTINNTAQSRIVTATVTVYQDGTGSYITADYGNKTGGNGTAATASVSTTQYPSSQYNFKCQGSLYNSNTENAGVGESWSKNVQ